MKLPARICLMAALAGTAFSPALEGSAKAVERPLSAGEIGQFHDGRKGHAFWFAPDNGAEALLVLLDQAVLDDLDPSQYPIATLRRLAAQARSGRNLRQAEQAFSSVFVRYAGDVARERNVGTLYVDPAARPRPVSAGRLLQVAAAAPSLAVFVDDMRWMHPYYSALRRALAEEVKDTKQPRRLRLLGLNRDRARVLPRGAGDYILVNSAAARLDFYGRG